MSTAVFLLLIISAMVKGDISRVKALSFIVSLSTRVYFGDSITLVCRILPFLDLVEVRVVGPSPYLCNLMTKWGWKQCFKIFHLRRRRRALNTMITITTDCSLLGLYVVFHPCLLEVVLVVAVVVAVVPSRGMLGHKLVTSTVVGRHRCCCSSSWRLRFVTPECPKKQFSLKGFEKKCAPRLFF